MFTIGCHLSSAKGYARMAKDAAFVNANTFQFFMRNPRGGRAKDIDPDDVRAFERCAHDQGIRTILAHASYTANPASNVAKTHDFALMVLGDDLARMEHTPHQLYNLHPGAAVGQTVEAAIDNTAGVLNAVMHPGQTSTVLLETMSGSGTELGATFEQLAAIIERVELNDRVGVCLDTCHVWAAGYDIAGDLDGVLDAFDRAIGLDRLRAVHLNDSKFGLGAHKDRHARIGEGAIGFEALAAFTKHPKLRHLPFYLETPNEQLAGFAEEIAALRAVHSAE